MGSNHIATWVTLGLLVGGAGCGRIGFDPLAVDALAASCTWVPGDDALFDNVNTRNTEWTPAISRDGLRLIFGRERNGGDIMELLVASRALRSAHFTVPVLLISPSAGIKPSNPSLTGDELELYYTALEGGSGTSRCIHVSRRDSAAMDWGPPHALTDLCGAYAPQVTGDGLRLYYNTSTPQGRVTFYMASRADRTVDFAAGAVIAGLDTANAQPRGFCTLSADERTIYFEAIPDSMPGVRSRIWQATRPSPTAPFDTPQPTEGLAESSGDGDPSITGDGELLVYTTLVGDQNDLTSADLRCAPADGARR